MSIKTTKMTDAAFLMNSLFPWVLLVRLKKTDVIKNHTAQIAIIVIVYALAGICQDLPAETAEMAGMV